LHRRRRLRCPARRAVGVRLRGAGRIERGDFLMGTEVSVILPAYNERDNLAQLVPEIAGVLRGQGLSYEILVVDDGSTDGTSDLMRGLVSDEVVGIRLRRNAGKSAALAAGLARVRGRFVVLMDADGQDDPREMLRLVTALAADDRLDLVTGRRTVRHDRF